ncbi:MAG: hypothetical protein ABI856_02805 [Nitrospira sp.]
MIRPEWQLVGLSPERRELLTAFFEFDELVEDIAREMRSVRFKKDKGTHEAKGSWRPIFWFDVLGTTFDRFFNSPYGYRAQYLADPESGRDKNASLIASLVDRLVPTVPQKIQIVDQVRRSLIAPHAKVWIEEDQHNPKGPQLVIEIYVAQWVAAAKEAHERLTASDPNITPKEVDRIFGVRAPHLHATCDDACA